MKLATTIWLLVPYITTLPCFSTYLNFLDDNRSTWKVQNEQKAHFSLLKRRFYCKFYLKGTIPEMNAWEAVASNATVDAIAMMSSY